MKKAIILHGMADSKEEYDGHEAEHHWIPWLKTELEAQGLQVVAPELPEPYHPIYEAWKEVFEGLAPDEETVLVGHSCGGGFLVRYLSENTLRVGKVLLVAPYLDPDGDHIPEFFDFPVKRNLVSQTEGVTIFISADDDSDILESVRIIKDSCDGIVTREFVDKGHFTFGEMGTREFPELLVEVN
ncbi:MAG: alpha/beta hydrolase [Candidatus Moranbacteria bacterium]|nr:alpha/beta hydrolase [Candidatus Moranbacteria bacterium]